MKQTQCGNEWLHDRLQRLPCPKAQTMNTNTHQKPTSLTGEFQSNFFFCAPTYTDVDENGSSNTHRMTEDGGWGKTTDHPGVNSKMTLRTWMNAT
jgi:hypothetical protein